MCSSQLDGLLRCDDNMVTDSVSLGRGELFVVLPVWLKIPRMNTNMKEWK